MKKKNEPETKEKKSTDLKARMENGVKQFVANITAENERHILLESYKKALTELAKAAEDGDLDAIKLLNECIQDSQELKLRKDLFGA